MRHWNGQRHFDLCMTDCQLTSAGMASRLPPSFTVPTHLASWHKGGGPEVTQWCEHVLWNKSKFEMYEARNHSVDIFANQQMCKIICIGFGSHWYLVKLEILSSQKYTQCYKHNYKCILFLHFDWSQEKYNLSKCCANNVQTSTTRSINLSFLKFVQVVCV